MIGLILHDVHDSNRKKQWSMKRDRRIDVHVSASKRTAQGREKVGRM